jgi:hypothetical protein
MDAVEFPVAAVSGGAVARIFRFSEPFLGPNGVQHPASAWASWSAADWVRLCPGWTILPLIDVPPAVEPWEVATIRPHAEWIISSDVVTATYTVAPLPLDARRTALEAAVRREFDGRLAAGMPYAGKRIQIDDPSRINLSGLAAAAALAAAGGAWPESYAAGWITADNTRLPLPTPADALALAAAAGAYYAALRQRRRDMLDAVAAAAAPETVDIAVGWPEGGV